MADFELWIADCHFQQAYAGARLPIACSCGADGYDSFRSQLFDYVQRQGLALLWVEDCFLAGQREIGPMARAVCQSHPVELSDLEMVDEEDQFATNVNPLIVSYVEDVEPLDMQLDVYPPQSVPEALQLPLLGEVDTIEDYGGAGAVPPMRTYAVLDASKMQYVLTGLIETSGLRFQSLFQKKTQQELGEYAPYLIELEENNSFTRNLFTCSEGIEGLW